MRHWLTALRVERGYSQKELAKAINVTQPAYSFYERGKTTPKPDKAKALGSLLGFDWTKFYE